MAPNPTPDADRYRNALSRIPGFREDWFPSAPRRVGELEVQARWFAGDFGRHFRTLDGRAVEIVQAGTWNHEAGPDFTDAAVRFDGGEALRGAVEIDPDARDWERHGHATNPAYETVCLHVFYRKSPMAAFARTASHRAVPQVFLDLDATAGSPPVATPRARPGRCTGPLAGMSERAIRDLLESAARFRMQQKAARIARWSEWHGPDEALFQALAETLGYKSNRLPFLVLAQRLTLRGLRRRGVSAEARLLGCSGFLEGTPPDDLGTDARDYAGGIWAEWWRHRSGHERLMLDRTAWNLSGTRPANHPQRRIAALGLFARHWPRLRALAESGDPAATARWLASLGHPFWSRHYTLASARTPAPVALLGASRIAAITANVFLPLGLRSGLVTWADAARWRGETGNRELGTAAIRLFSGRDPAPFVNTLVGQQGLQQVYRDFCQRDVSDCRLCRFPEVAASWDDTP